MCRLQGSPITSQLKIKYGARDRLSSRDPLHLTNTPPNSEISKEEDLNGIQKCKW
jgi:hypothetical protein